jgi:hypothetical protein
MAQGMPAVFLGHGNPMNALLRNQYTEAWTAIGTNAGASPYLALTRHRRRNDLLDQRKQCGLVGTCNHRSVDFESYGIQASKNQGLRSLLSHERFEQGNLL